MYAHVSVEDSSLDKAISLILIELISGRGAVVAAFLEARGGFVAASSLRQTLQALLAAAFFASSFVKSVFTLKANHRFSCEPLP